MTPDNVVWKVRFRIVRPVQVKVACLLGQHTVKIESYPKCYYCDRLPRRRWERVLNRLTRRDPWTLESPSERLSHVLNPLLCKAIGHDPEKKMYDTICSRCRIILR